MLNRFVIFVTAIGLTLGLGACGNMSRIDANITGYSKECIEGVSYIQFPSGVTTQYDKSGHVVTC